MEHQDVVGVPPEFDLFSLLDAHEEQVRAETGAEFGEDDTAMVLTRT